MRKWRLAGQDEFDSITSPKKQLKHDFMIFCMMWLKLQFRWDTLNHGMESREGNTGLQMMIFMICTKLTGRIRSCFGYTPE